MDSKFEGILEPISAEFPCGEDLSFSPEFDRIQEARREDDASIDYGEWQADLKQADWPMVVRECTGLLAKRSKDLRLSAWLTEGLVKENGLAGLGDGIQIMSRLIAEFGDQIHPLPDAGDQEQRVGNLSWFVVRIAQLVRQIPITDATSVSFNLNDYESARLLQAQMLRQPDSVPDLEQKMTLEKFSAAAAKTDKSRYLQWIADAQRCSLALPDLVRASDALFGSEGPSFGVLKESLDAIQERLKVIAKELGIFASKEAAVEKAIVSIATSGNDQSFPSTHVGPFKTRAQALEALRQVAIFFRNTEPHSPVAYLADKAAHWGAMPLHSWLRSVVKDQGTLSHIEELLGLEETLGQD
jgi:type VI secretion system protein ImpA